MAVENITALNTLLHEESDPKIRAHKPTPAKVLGMKILQVADNGFL